MRKASKGTIVHFNGGIGSFASILHPRVGHVCFIQCTHVFSPLQTQVRTNTDANRKERKKEKGVLFSLRGRDLETAAVNGRKTMKHFPSSSGEALPGSRSVTSLPASSSREGRDAGEEVSGSMMENVQ